MREGPREASTRLPGPLSHLAPRNSQPLPVVLLLLPVRLPAALLVHLGRALDRDHLAQRLAGDGDGDQVVAGLHERALAAAAEAATAAALAAFTALLGALAGAARALLGGAEVEVAPHPRRRRLAGAAGAERRAA